MVFKLVKCSLLNSVSILFLIRLVFTCYLSTAFYTQTPILTRVISFCWLDSSSVNKCILYKL